MRLLGRALQILCVVAALTIVIIVSQSNWFQSQALAAMHSQSNYTLTYEVDYANVPDLTFTDLTMQVTVGNISGAQVTANGALVPHVYDANSGVLQFTADASPLIISLTDVADPTKIGQVEKATLKDDKKWAWSIGFDDNTFLESTIAIVESYGYRGTVYQIANAIDDTRDEDWVIDKIDMLAYLDNGWSMGNHTWGHPCYQSGDRTATIVDGYNRIAQIVSESTQPNYKVISFAAPCFDAGYHPFILNMRNAGTTAVQFNESGSSFPLVVDSDITADFTLDSRLVYALGFDNPVPRDTRIEYDVPASTAEVDWIANRATSTRHFWHNTVAHGNNVAEVQAVIDHIYNKYGAGGTDEVWIAPADQIYSYLLVRDLSVVTLSSISQAPGTVIQTAPLGQITEPTPEFRWEIEPSADEYKLVVYRVDTQQVVFMKTYAASAICSATECTAQPATSELILDAALYTWLVQAQNAVGVGPWSIYGP